MAPPAPYYLPWPNSTEDVDDHLRDANGVAPLPPHLRETDGAAAPDLETEPGAYPTRMVFVRCEGWGDAGRSISNPAQVKAVRQIASGLLRMRHLDVLVLSPYSKQVAALRQALRGLGTRVSTVDAAQGQEADLVIISTVRANRRYAAGFTARAATILVGHAPTIGSAAFPGFPELLVDLLQRKSVMEYRYGDRSRPIAVIGRSRFDEIQKLAAAARKEADKARASDTQEAANRRRSWAHLWGMRVSKSQQERDDILQAATQIRGHADEACDSKAFPVAFAHVCSLRPCKGWPLEAMPRFTADWDRKLWSYENVFTIKGLPLDPGKLALALLMLVLQIRLGLPPRLPGRRGAAPVRPRLPRLPRGGQGARGGQCQRRWSPPPRGGWRR